MPGLDGLAVKPGYLATEGKAGVQIVGLEELRLDLVVRFCLGEREGRQEDDIAFVRIDQKSVILLVSWWKPSKAGHFPSLRRSRKVQRFGCQPVSQGEATLIEDSA